METGRVKRRPIRRKYERIKNTEVKIRKQTNKKVDIPIRINRGCTFLQYIRLVFRWATSNHDITRTQLDLLLYLYGEGLFTRYSFMQAHKMIGLMEAITFKSFLEKGFVVIYKEKTSKSPRLYTLSDKSKKMCSRIHKMLMGEEMIPETARYNKMVTSDLKVDEYFMKAAQKLNRRSREGN